MNTRTNEEWLAALTAQPEDAQAEAWNDLGNFLLRTALVYLTLQRSELAGWGREAIEDLAEDLAQEALIEIRTRLDQFKGKSKFTTWAYQFVVFRAASELRRHRYRNISFEQLQEEGVFVLPAAPEGRESVDPEQTAERRYYIRLLREIIESELNERQRAAIVGVYLQGCAMDEVAGALETSRNALYKLIHDARKRIVARLRARQLTQGDILAAFED
jgi:RNA polymerase sigma-70 factor (ECF subfamily)